MNLCETCHKSFKSEYLLNKHKNSKQKCVNTLDKDDELNNLLRLKHNIICRITKYKKIAENESDSYCMYCKKTFSTKGNMLCHQNKSCNVYIKLNTEKKELEKEIEMVKNKFNNIIDKNANNTENNTVNKTQTINMNANTINNITNNTNNNITNNNNVVINVINYGKENLDHITTKELVQMLNKRKDGFYKFIEKIHFDKEKPEYHNVYIPDIRRKQAMIYKNDKWMIGDRDTIIDMIKDDKILLLDNKVNELNDLIPENTRRIYNNLYNDLSEKDDKLEKNINDNIKYILYNNRDIPCSANLKTPRMS